MVKMFRRVGRARGAAMMITVFFFFTISVAIALSATVALRSELNLYRSLASSKYAIEAGDSGVEDSLYRIITGKQISSQEIYGLNNATATVNMVDVSATEKAFFVTGKNMNSYRKIYLDVSKNINGVFPYGAQVGEGGVSMKNGVRVDGTGLNFGHIYSNGPVKGAPGVVVDGNVIVGSSLTPDTASSTAYVTDENVGKSSPTIDYAQSFVIGTTSPGELTKLSLYLKRTNSSPSNVIANIVADNGGVPATTALASTTIVSSTVGTSYSWFDVIFSSPAVVNPGTTYWIVLDAAQNNTKYLTWGRSGSDTYSDGHPAYKDDWSTAGVWGTPPAGDMMFGVYLGSGISMLDSVSVTGTAKAEKITNTTVSGDAYYQTISGSTVSGTSYPGSATQPLLNLPFTQSQIAQWIGEATSSGTVNGSCGTGGDPACDTFPLTLGPLEITGDLLVNNNQTLTVSGTLYVHGNIIVSNGSRIQCAFTYGANSCMVIADGYINVNNNGTFAGSGASGSFIMMLTTKSGCIGAGTIVFGCGPLNSAIAISNNISGALFYAGNSMIAINNGATVTAVVGYGLDLDNNVQIVYDPLVSNISFVTQPTGSTGAWNVNRWTEFQ